MHVVIAGPTGTLGFELIRQALSHPAITTITALGRREATVPSRELLYPGAKPEKLRSVVVKDFLGYAEDEDVKKALGGVDGVIWTIALTPETARKHTWEDNCKISRDFAIYGIKTLSQWHKIEAASKASKDPLRFIYLSGSNAERDQRKKPWIMGDVLLMRGDAENKILEFASHSSNGVQASIAKPGVMKKPGEDSYLQKVRLGLLSTVVGVPSLNLTDAAATLLEQMVRKGGMERETLDSDFLDRTGKEIWEKRGAELKA